MPAKKKEKKPKEKTYTYEEYREAFCADPEPELAMPDPHLFGLQLAKQVLKKIEQTSQEE